MSSENLPENESPKRDWNRRRVSYLRMGRSFIDGINPSRSLNPLRGLIRRRRELVETAMNWFYSRNWELGYSAAPVALVSLLALLTAVWAGTHADFSTHRAFLLRSLQKSAAAEQIPRRELSLRALRDLEPLNADHALQLADLLKSNNRISEAIDVLRPYAPADSAGSPAVRMWLLDLAESDSAALPLTEDEKVSQLQRVLLENEGHPKAAIQLAEIWFQRQEWQLAERCLETAAAVNPEVNLQLLEMRLRRQQNPEDRVQTAQAAVKALRDKLKAQPGDVDLTCALAEALFLAGLTSEARDSLEELLERRDDERVKKTLSQLETLVAQSRLLQSFENKDACTVLLVRALELNPANSDAIALLRRLDRAGALITPKSLQGCLDYWRDRMRNDPKDRGSVRAMAILLEIVREPRAAADLISNGIDQHPQDRLFLVDLLVKAQHPEQAREMAEIAVGEQRSLLLQDPANREARVAVARCLLILQRPEEARQFLVDGTPQLLLEWKQDPEWQYMFGAASLAVFDNRTDLTDRVRTLDSPAMPVIRDKAEVRELLKFLDDAVRSGPITDATSIPLAAIDRIVRIALSGQLGAREADKLLTNLRGEGIHQLEILSLLAARALAMEQYEKAVQWLEVANSMTSGSNPLILNNLAIAEVRSKPSRPWEALKHVQASLEILDENPEILSTRGEVHLALNSLNDAEKDLRQSLRIRGDRPKVHRMLADVLKRTGHNEEALVHLNEADKLERQQLATSRSLP
ncbi:MAG: tetratricopeptide repeat protein [Planctomyces sp.]|jgi:tetratricopeptide (TPR) repeat protein